MAPFDLQIHLFGPLELTQNGASLLPSTPKARALLAYLILHHNRPIPRDRLIGLFWPERSDVRARRALSHTLWQIRAALGSAASRLTTDEYTISFTLYPGDWLDVAVFGDKVAAAHASPFDESGREAIADLNEAVDLYRADFLEAYYDDWALLERERLRELYLQALERLIVLYKQRGDYERALSCAQRLVAADPLREAAHRELMRLYHLLSRDRAALEQYVTLHRLLEDELGLEPAAATTALYHEISNAMEEPGVPHLPSPPPPPPALRDIGHLPFIGRGQERAALLDAVQAAAQGRGGIALVEGNAGVGKTRLVDEIAAGARWRGMQVGLGRAVPDVALYQPLVEALMSLLTPLRTSQLATLVKPLWLSAVAPLLPPVAALPGLPELPPMEPERERERLWEGLAHCLNELAAIAPLVLILEDLHWADEATLSTLLRVAPRLRQSRLLILLTVRSAEARERPVVWRTLDAIDRASPVRRVRLLPFDIAETTALVGRALGVTQEAASFARQLWPGTGGNALFLVEVLKSLLEEGTLVRTDDGWRFPAPDVPLPTVVSLQTVVGERLARLSPSQRVVLELAAVLGDEAEFPVLSRATLEPDTLLPALEALIRRGFLIETEARYRFEHEMVREIVYRAIAPKRRRALHARVGDVLEEIHPERVESLALHFYRGGIRHKALTYALQAGEQAQAVYDYKTALAHYRRALSLVGDDSTLRWEVLARQNDALNVLGCWGEQAEVHKEMAQLAEEMDDPRRRVHVLYLVGKREKMCGDPHKALGVLEKALRLARADGDRKLIATGLMRISEVHWLLGDTSRTQAAAEKALELFRETGDFDGEQEARGALAGLHVGLTGDYGQALMYFEEDRRIAAQLGDRHREAIDLGNIALTRAFLGDYGAAQRALTAALDFVTQIGDRYAEGGFCVFQALNLRGLGELEEAQRFAQRALRVNRQIGSYNFEIQALKMLGLIALDRDDPQQARAWFEQGVAVAQAQQQMVDWAEQLSHLALTYARLGDYEGALRLSGRALEALERERDVDDHLKRACWERACIVGVAQGAKAAVPLLERAYQLLMSIVERISDPDLRRSFLENVAENRAIVAAYRLGRPPAFPHRRRFCLPRADAPTGRPLRDDEYVEVTWSIAAPEDDEVIGKVARRRHRLLRLLREAAEQAATPTVYDLSEALGVSISTVKRDLAALRAQGHDVRTRGSHSTGD